MNTHITIGDLILKNPITVASGTAGYGEELSQFMDISTLGAIFTKGLSIEPRAGMDIARLKRDYGHRLVLIGNVDCSTVLVDGPAEAVCAQTERVIRVAAPGGGFLLSTSNSVHPGVKPELYLAMLDTARTVGHYPIGS